ncbi:MAG: MlaD family protein [Planctomycetota bacterium]|jgi:paraquat-inducible protein B
MNGGHFKLGLFVTVATVLLVVFLLALGTVDRFKPQVKAETYFTESIQNLQRGAAVRFRGVDVGTVDWIAFATTRYPAATDESGKGRYRSYIMVRLKLYTETLLAAGLEDIRPHLERNVEEGLRARLAVTGLGGPAYVAIDFLDPNAYPPPPIEWSPEHLYIPSAPSTVGSIIDSLASILRRTDELSVVESLASIADDLKVVLTQIEESELLSTSGGALEELRAASAEARALLGDPRLDGIIDDAGATLDGARTLLESDRGELETLVRDMTRMAGTLEQAGASLDTLATAVNEGGLIPQLERMADDLGPAGRDLADLAGRLDRLVRGNEQQIVDAIRSLRDAALAVEALLEELQANPSRILSPPPPTGTPGGSP